MGEASTLKMSNQPHKDIPEHIVEDPEPLLTVPELAQFLRLEPQTIRALAREGKIPAFKIGRIWRFRRGDILIALKKAQEEAITEFKLSGVDNREI